MRICISQKKKDLQFAGKIKTNIYQNEKEQIHSAIAMKMNRTKNREKEKFMLKENQKYVPEEIVFGMFSL